MSKKKYSDSSASAFGASLIAESATGNYSEATEELFEGMGILKSLAEQYKDVEPEKFTHGRMFEIIETTKRNYENKISGNTDYYKTTDSIGNPHAAADILKFDKNGNVIEQIQAKSSRLHTSAAKRLSEDKYQGMKKWTNEEHVESVKNYSSKVNDKLSEKSEQFAAEGKVDAAEKFSNKASNYSDTAKNIEETKTSYDESVNAAKNPKTYALKEEISAMGTEALHAGLYGALAGGGISLAISIVKNGVTKENLSDAGRGALKGAAVAGGASIVRNVAKKNGIESLTQGKVASALVINVINTGVLIYHYAKGKITLEDMAIELGSNGVGTLGGLYSGAAIGSVAGPVGSIVGSVVGYMMSTQIYQATIHIFKNAKLAEAEAERLKELANEIIPILQNQRKEMENKLKKYFSEHYKIINKSFKNISTGINKNNLSLLSKNLYQLSYAFGTELKFKNFDEFNEFMNNDATVLTL